jgi:hypothetical protein
MHGGNSRISGEDGSGHEGTTGPGGGAHRSGGSRVKVIERGLGRDEHGRGRMGERGPGGDGGEWSQGEDAESRPGSRYNERPSYIGFVLLETSG